ncbi:NACHT domain-containing protein [Streptomyces sp. NRRL F-2580]|uniref:NACHT domain-containing protein n=1 Tax=Streptomyces sp. NRRL F-2580 TaxID=1463841 RepID=UPI0004CB0C15|nr:NACHT domain-containing protein [Streptomyces sp. NRRL F-2580]
MTGLETALLRTAGTAAGTLLRSRLGQVPGAGLADAPVRPAARWRRPVRLGEPEIRRLAATLADRLGAAAARLPEHERLAVLDTVAGAFARAGAVDVDALFAADLDPAVLAAALPVPPGAGLSAAAEAAYRDLVRLCCAHVLEYVTTLPGFGARAGVELVRRTGELAQAVDRLASRSDGAAYAFEERYAQYVADTHGRLQLFGLTLSRSRREWPLDVAYISLAVSGEQPLLPGGPEAHQTPLRAEQALASTERVLLRGPAGSGKSTLVQWLALNAARQTDGPWSTCVPFVLRLRSFTSSDSLPLPEDFLRASGVPLSAPPGWVEDLMLSGRALVLVDGVDEVPQRLRARTETWLRSLVSAFPRARYVVTTRPSAVPEDWLAGQGFTTHSMLAMEQQDIRAFVAHWHAAARAEGQEADAYEASLLEAVGARRDLARLATNPLMCALLCALNQDRRMQLPRARKELYDAALDMLLVRRDTEREISGVEGVYLTRDEQIALLQRFAYWLIRNGQVEAGRDEAIGMVDEWLAAMPQVRGQGDAEQVFSHLLIRSGLLLEPAPGSVLFVHRTFQDYLGAKAAVESRDFGVLVKNAHDDTWDDVIRMAVGHGRPDERTHILRGLLRRADKTKGARSRLILLAAACLEHAPELDPAVRAEVQARTGELLPPTRFSQADELAKAGPLVLELLPATEHLNEDEAAAALRTAWLVGGDQALEFLTRSRTDDRQKVRQQLAHGWPRFPDAKAYAETVLAHTRLEDVMVPLVCGAQLAALDHLRGLHQLHLTWDGDLPAEVMAQRQLTHLTLFRNTALTDLGPLAGFENLIYLGLYHCRNVSGLEALTALPLDYLSLTAVADTLRLAPLTDMDALRQLSLNYRPAGTDRVSDLPAHPRLHTLHLQPDASPLALDDIAPWPELRWLTLCGRRQAADFAGLRGTDRLTGLQILDHEELDAAVALRCPRLTSLFLNNSRTPGGLHALKELPELTRLSLYNGGAYDLTPLADLDRLAIEVGHNVRLRGADAIPPERLTYPW